LSSSAVSARLSQQRKLTAQRCRFMSSLLRRSSCSGYRHHEDRVGVERHGANSGGEPLDQPGAPISPLSAPERRRNSSASKVAGRHRGPEPRPSRKRIEGSISGRCGRDYPCMSPSCTRAASIDCGSIATAHRRELASPQRIADCEPRHRLGCGTLERGFARSACQPVTHDCVQVNSVRHAPRARSWLLRRPRTAVCCAPASARRAGRQHRA